MSVARTAIKYFDEEIAAIPPQQRIDFPQYHPLVKRIIDVETEEVEYFIYNVKEDGTFCAVRGNNLAEVKKAFVKKWISVGGGGPVSV